jgi:hypothetical protein
MIVRCILSLFALLLLGVACESRQFVHLPGCYRNATSDDGYGRELEAYASDEEYRCLTAALSKELFSARRVGKRESLKLGELVHLHVYKTGGTTMNSFIKRWSSSVTRLLGSYSSYCRNVNYHQNAPLSFLFSTNSGGTEIRPFCRWLPLVSVDRGTESQASALDFTLKHKDSIDFGCTQKLDVVQKRALSNRQRLYGHFWFGCFEVPPTRAVISMFRDPIVTSVSSVVYEHNQVMGKPVASVARAAMLVAEWAATLLDADRRVQFYRVDYLVRMLGRPSSLAGTWKHAFSARAPDTDERRAALRAEIDEALDHMASIDIVAVSERSSELGTLLADVMPADHLKPDPFAARYNRGSRAFSTGDVIAALPKRTLDIIAEFCHVDMYLYKAALAMHTLLYDEQQKQRRLAVLGRHRLALQQQADKSTNGDGCADQLNSASTAALASELLARTWPLLFAACVAIVGVVLVKRQRQRQRQVEKQSRDV